MKRKRAIGSSSYKKRQRKSCTTMVKGSLANHLKVQLEQVLLNFPPKSSRFQNLLDSEAQPESAPLIFETDAADEKDFILSQEFFCTPEMPSVMGNLDLNKENIPCPRSPVKIKTGRMKRPKLDVDLATFHGTISNDHQELLDLRKDTFASDEVKTEKAIESQRGHSYVSQSVVALRCRVMPPPCLENPYIRDKSELDNDCFGNQRSKCAGFAPGGIGSDGLSRYQTDFHEIEKIGSDNFNYVYKVLKRIDGCMYAVKHSMRQLHQETERRKALMEVQALAASDSRLLLEFIHGRGIAHLDVKPENIYVKGGVYKLGDFGCATLLDKTLPIEEGDARYMPQEILNEKYDHLDRVDIFSLGAAVYELVRGSPLPESGPSFLNLRGGKLPLLPGHSLTFQNLLKAMMDPDPVRQPSAKELLENLIFDRYQRCEKNM